MKKEFITYEQAFALKELGFNEPCFGRFNPDNDLVISHTETYNTDSRKTLFTQVPTYSQAFRWFREKYGLSGLIEIGTQEFSYQVFNNKGNRQLGTEPLKYNGTYEEAESACLDKLIEIVKNK